MAREEAVKDAGERSEHESWAQNQCRWMMVIQISRGSTVRQDQTYRNKNLIVQYINFMVSSRDCQ